MASSSTPEKTSRTTSTSRPRTTKITSCTASSSRPTSSSSRPEGRPTCWCTARSASAEASPSSSPTSSRSTSTVWARSLPWSSGGGTRYVVLEVDQPQQGLPRTAATLRRTGRHPFPSVKQLHRKAQGAHPFQQEALLFRPKSEKLLQKTPRPPR